MSASLKMVGDTDSGWINQYVLATLPKWRWENEVDCGTFSFRIFTFLTVSSDKYFWSSKKWPKPGLFLCLFSFFSHIAKTNKAHMIKHRWCTWESNPGWQTGKCRRIHWATATNTFWSSFCPRSFGSKLSIKKSNSREGRSDEEEERQNLIWYANSLLKLNCSYYLSSR